MATFKNLVNGAATAAVGALALQSGAQARKTLDDTRSGAIDGLNEVAAHDGYDAVTYAAYATPYKAATAAASVPALAPAFFLNLTGNATAVPCTEVEFLAALELLIVDLDPAVNASECASVSELNREIFSSLEGVFGPQVATSDAYVQGVYATLEGEVKSISDFTRSTDACNNVAAYNNQVIDAVAGIFDTLSLLDNVTTCEPYSN